MTAIIKINYLSLVFGLFQFLLVQQGNTTELPNSVDLKASYCIGLLTQSLSMQQQSKPTQSDLSVMPSLETIHAKYVDKLESALERINYYPRPYQREGILRNSYQSRFHRFLQVVSLPIDPSNPVDRCAAEDNS